MKRNFIRLAVLTLCLTLLTGAFCTGVYVSCLAEERGSEYALPVFMYHHILREKAKHGKFVISPEEFEADLKYLKENGYTAIGAEDLLSYKEQGTPLPEKPVMLTFDDGYLSYMEYAVPLLEQYDMKALVSVVGAYSDTYTENGDRCVSYAYFNWEDIKNLSQSEHTEIGNHTYDMHKVSGGRQGCARKKGENKDAYCRVLGEDLTKMQTLLKAHTGKEAICFTYPFGFCCSDAETKVQGMGFGMSLCCEEGINFLSRDTSLFRLKRFNRAHGRSVAYILGKET